MLLQGTYHAEYLVRGAAPSGITAVDIQRGRWTEGHYQVSHRGVLNMQAQLAQEMLVSAFLQAANATSLQELPVLQGATCADSPKWHVCRVWVPATCHTAHHQALHIAHLPDMLHPLSADLLQPQEPRLLPAQAGPDGSYLLQLRHAVSG